MKKLLFVISSLEDSGGSERSLTMRVNYLVENFDYVITIVTTRNYNCNSFYYLDSRIKVVNIPISFNKDTFIEKMKYIFSNSYIEEKPLYDFIIKNKFEICSSLGSETFLYDSRKRWDFVRIKENRFTYKKMLNDENISVFKRIWRFLRFRVSISVQKKMDYIVTLTDEDRDFWSKYLPNIVVIPNFINFNDAHLLMSKRKSVIAVGRLEKEKDFYSLIYAFEPVLQRFGDWRLEIYGDGSLKKQLQELIFSLGLQEQVFLKGTTADIYSKYAESSIYAITSFYEGFPNAMLEAMSCGLPVVGFESVGGVKVLLKDSYNGFLIKDRDIESLGNKIAELIEDVALRESMGRNSRLISNDFSEEKIMLKWHQFYSSILEK